MRCHRVGRLLGHPALNDEDILACEQRGFRLRDGRREYLICGVTRGREGRRRNWLWSAKLAAAGGPNKTAPDDRRNQRRVLVKHESFVGNDFGTRGMLWIIINESGESGIAWR